MIQEACLLAEPLQRRLSVKLPQRHLWRTNLREEQAGEREIRQDALVHRLAKDPANETIPVNVLLTSY